MAGRPIVRLAGSSTTDLIRLPPARMPLKMVAAANRLHSRVEVIFMPPRLAAARPASVEVQEWGEVARWAPPRCVSTGCVGQDLNLRTPTGQDSEPCAFDQAGPPTHDAAGRDFVDS